MVKHALLEHSQNYFTKREQIINQFNDFLFIHNANCTPPILHVTFGKICSIVEVPLFCIVFPLNTMFNVSILILYPMQSPYLNYIRSKEFETCDCFYDYSESSGLVACSTICHRARLNCSKPILYYTAR